MKIPYAKTHCKNYRSYVELNSNLKSSNDPLGLGIFKPNIEVVSNTKSDPLHSFAQKFGKKISLGGVEIYWGREL